MSAIKWIKISTDIFDDEKIKLIGTMGKEADSILVIWIKLLVLAGQKNMRGEIFMTENIPYTDEMLATVFHRELGTVRLALKTFQKFGMIEILEDQTIHIVNWNKHQSVDGLEKIRLSNADRQKKFRENRQHRQLEANSLGELARNVTGRDGVTGESVTVTQQNKSKNKEESPLSPCGQDSEAVDAIQHAEAKVWLNELFGRKRSWSHEEDHLLSEILPISREDKKLIDWAHRLAPEHRFHELTKLKQNLTTLLREFSAEVDKIRSVRKQLGINVSRGSAESMLIADWPAGTLDAAIDIYGESMPLPRRFVDLAPSVQARIRAHVTQKSPGENAA